MAGVVDKFTFMLMLDAHNFKKGGATAMGVIDGIKTTFLKTYALIGGVDLFKNMLNTYTSAAKSIDNFNVLTGENITELQAWQKAIQDTDGDIGAFQGTVRKLVDMQEQLKLTGVSSSEFGYIRRFVGIDPRNMKGLDILKQIGKYLSTIKDNAYAFKQAQLMGIDESTFVMLRRYGDNLDGVIRANKRYAFINRQGILEARKYQKMISEFKSAWLEVSATVSKELIPALSALFPYVEKIGNYLAKDLLPVLTEHILPAMETLFDFVGKVGYGVGAVVGATSNLFSKVGDGIGKAVDDTSNLLSKGPSANNIVTGIGSNFLNPLNFMRPVDRNSIVSIDKMTVVADDPKQFMSEMDKVQKKSGGLSLMPFQLGGVNR